jgi:hypothetical protein
MTPAFTTEAPFDFAHGRRRHGGAPRLPRRVTDASDAPKQNEKHFNLLPSMAVTRQE